MVRKGSSNGNWKGGVTQVETADDLVGRLRHLNNEVRCRILSLVVVDEVSDCWNWTGGVFKSNGRARISLGKSHLVSRISYAVFKGFIGDFLVLHSCDNVLCVNPDHLWLGTNADNSADMTKKGRQASGDRNGSRLHPERLARGDDNPARKYPGLRAGENNGRALLTEDQVREIRQRYVYKIQGVRRSNICTLAKEFGVAPHVIRGIVRGDTWRAIL